MMIYPMTTKFHRPELPRRRILFPELPRRRILLFLLLSALGSSCSAQSMAIKQARIDFPRCSEPKYVGEWRDEIELRVCEVIPVAYEVTPIGGARRKR